MCTIITEMLSSSSFPLPHHSMDGSSCISFLSLLSAEGLNLGKQPDLLLGGGKTMRITGEHTQFKVWIPTIHSLFGNALVAQRPFLPFIQVYSLFFFHWNIYISHSSDYCLASLAEGNVVKQLESFAGANSKLYCIFKNFVTSVLLITIVTAHLLVMY